MEPLPDSFNMESDPAITKLLRFVFKYIDQSAQLLLDQSLVIQNLPAVKDECGLGHGGVDAGVVQAHKLVPLSAHHHRMR